MPTINKDVDFIGNDEAGEAVATPDSKAERDHQVQDVLHKMFVIHSAYAHNEAMKKMMNKPKASTRRKGALDV